jgi:hypothetical protein
MKSLLLASALMCTVSFHYKDHVQVISGFYEGCIGTVEEQREHGFYEVKLERCGQEEVTNFLDVQGCNLKLLLRRPVGDRRINP